MSRARGRLDLDVLGRPLTVEGATPSLAAWVERHWRRPSAGVAAKDFRIDVTCTADPALPRVWRAKLPATAARADAPAHVETNGEWDEALLGTATGGALLRITPYGARVAAWGVDAGGAAGRGSLSVALHEAVRASGLLPLHAAAAIAPTESGATAFLGASGVGKSTTLIALAERGWTPVCEDFGWLDPRVGRLHAWDRAIRLHPDAIERYGPLALGAQVGAKRVVGYDALAVRFGASRCVAVPLRRLAHLERVTGPSGWGPLSRAAAVPPLWEAIGLPLTRAAQQWVGTSIGRLVGGVELAALRLGEPPYPSNGPA